MRYKTIYANYAGKEEKHWVRHQNRQCPHREAPCKKVQLHRKQGGKRNGK